MKETFLSTAMTAFTLSLASLTLPPVGDLKAADIFTQITASPRNDVGNSLAQRGWQRISGGRRGSKL